MITEAVILFLLLERATSSIRAHHILNQMTPQQEKVLIELANSKNIMMHHQIASVTKNHGYPTIAKDLCQFKLLGVGKHRPQPKHHFYSGFLKKLSQIKIIKGIMKLLVHHHKLVYWRSHRRVVHISEIGFHIIHLIKHKNRALYNKARRWNQENDDLIPKHHRKHHILKSKNAQRKEHS